MVYVSWGKQTFEKLGEGRECVDLMSEKIPKNGGPKSLRPSDLVSTPHP